MLLWSIQGHSWCPDGVKILKISLSITLNLVRTSLKPLPDVQLVGASAKNAAPFFIFSCAVFHVAPQRNGDLDEANYTTLPTSIHDNIKQNLNLSIKEM